MESSIRYSPYENKLAPTVSQSSAESITPRKSSVLTSQNSILNGRALWGITSSYQTISLSTHSSLTTSSSTHLPSASFVSETIISLVFPQYLLPILYPHHPNCNIYIQIYSEEKQVLRDHRVYEFIKKGWYRELRNSSSPQVIPTMLCLTIKKEADTNPHCTKGCIIVLGNPEGEIFHKSKLFAPVIS